MDNRPADTPIGTTRANELNESSTAAQARDRAHDLKEKAKERAREAAAGQKERAAGEISALASALHEAGGRLGSEHHMSSQLLDRVAGMLDQVSERVERRDIDGLMREARMYARSNPAVFIGAAMALGFAASRFLKASADDAYGDSRAFDTAGSTPVGYDATPDDLAPTSGIGAVPTDTPTTRTAATAGTTGTTASAIDPLTGVRDGSR